MTIIKWPNKVLSKKSNLVTSFDNILLSYLDKMKDLMIKENGLGLSAPQVGLNLSFFLMKDNKDDIIEIINPEIMEQEGEQYENEGCLSFGNITIKIARPTSVHFRHQSKDGIFHEAIAWGREAVCFSHEFDHLQGVTIYDRVNRKQRKMIERRFK